MSARCVIKVNQDLMSPLLLEAIFFCLFIIMDKIIVKCHHFIPESTLRNFLRKLLHEF